MSRPPSQARERKESLSAVNARKRDEAALLKRVGISVLGNTTFTRQSQEETHEAERELEELRREARLRASRCNAQLESLSAEARAEQERRIISEKVSRELDILREEMRRKEAAEDERLRHLYRGIMGSEVRSDSGAGPDSSAPEPVRLPDTTSLGQSGNGQGRSEYFDLPGALSFPPLIVSETKLLDAPSKPRAPGKGSFVLPIDPWSESIDGGLGNRKMRRRRSEGHLACRRNDQGP
eukprot:TRINITY_DN35803_c0_g1_i2.p1 TRINITY_DN35803_c0_g1~~TRINITY_DN35803_c0_g1_i2.p1  ORF type:complete len:238 (+),score=40.52 TRINITY_DN35803_c0_g1_i2:64-777(+)